jgi:hypothetical protein
VEHLLRETARKKSRYECFGFVFFRALQAKQWSLGSETTIDGLVAQVLRASVEFDPRKIDCGFLTLQTCLNGMLEVNGGNNYKI